MEKKINYLFFFTLSRLSFLEGSFLDNDIPDSKYSTMVDLYSIFIKEQRTIQDESDSNDYQKATKLFLLGKTFRSKMDLLLGGDSAKKIFADAAYWNVVPTKIMFDDGYCCHGNPCT